MTIGTAGYTAARCVIALEAAGLTPDAGPVLVTGATRRRRLDRGRHPRRARLRGRRLHRQGPGVPARRWAPSEVISREDAAGDAARPLEKTRWAGAVDCVGGEVLAGVIRGLQLRRRGRGVRQHRRREAAHDRAPVHPARRLAARRGFGADADRGAHGDLEAARDRPAPAAPRRRDRPRDRPRRPRGRAHSAILAGELSGAGPIVQGLQLRALPLSRRATSSSRRSSSSPWPTASSSAAQNSTSVAALAAQVQRLAQPGLTGIQAGDDRLQARAGGLVGQRLLDIVP